MHQLKKRWWGVAALAAFMAPMMIVGLPGCSGGNGGGLGSGNSQNGTFSGSATNLGNGQTGTFSLNSFSDNTVNGTIVVSAPPAAASARKLAAVTSLPAGTYTFSGTRNGNSFSAHGDFSGPPAFSFDVNGTLSTTSSAGTWAISGTINGEPFEFGGTITVVVDGGGNGGGGNISFTNSGSNANTSTFTPISAVGMRASLGTVNEISVTLTAGTSASSLRSLTVAVFKAGTIQAGDTFTIDDDSTDSGNATVLYGEGAPFNKAWQAHTGTVTVTALTGNSVTLEVDNALMQPSSLAGPGQTNQATGEFHVSGDATGSLN